MPDDDRDPRLVDLARAFADQCMVVRQRPEPGVEQRVTFPDGSIGERLGLEPDEASWSPRYVLHWRVTAGHNLARQWVEAERDRAARALERWRVTVMPAPEPPVDPEDGDEFEARRSAYVQAGCQGDFDQGWAAGVAWERSKHVPERLVPGSMASILDTLDHERRVAGKG